MPETSTTTTPTTKPTLGLTGLTMNAMALIAPGAFLWLTYAQQSLYGAPMAGCAMWFGIVVALLLCFATAICYAELSKLYPGAGSSYVFAEQAFLSKTKAYKFARIAKFAVGWASHLYYWVYPGVMVGVTAILVGYLLGQLFPSVFSSAVPSPLFMVLFALVFPFFVGWIAYRGVTGATSVNIAINVIQISALVVFSVIALGYRFSHGEGSKAVTLNPDGVPVTKVIAMTTTKDDKGVESTNPAKDKEGNYVFEKNADGTDKDFTLTYASDQALDKGADPKNPTDTFQFHTSAASVISPHGFSFAIIQACIAILILVGFESVTAMGEEAKNAKRDIPRAVLLSLFIQGVVCYLFEYFAANYFLNSGYKLTQAAASPAPIGDMMQIAGTWLFGSPTAGWWFMMIEAFTVFLALIGTTLSCINTGARVTYAMGRDDELAGNLGVLHTKNLTPHRAIWTLCIISAVIGVFGVLFYFCGGAALTADAIKGLPQNFWYSFGIFPHDTAANIPQSLLIITLTSNFGTFLLYMMTCIIAIVAFREHHSFHGFKHVVVPVFGLLANLLCMLFYLVGPFSVAGMSFKEPYIALGIAALWGIYGAIYFLGASKKKAKSVLIESIGAKA
ncbi:MAG TPA: APC family permease [Chthoniobacterales bacterium]|nr:APC family permease [Chthoniobacterales bacterium]